MAGGKLLDTLEEQTSQRERDILAKASLEAETMLREARKETEQMHLSIDRNLHLERERALKAAATGVELKVRSAALSREKADLDSLKASLLDLIAALPPASKARILERLAADAKESLRNAGAKDAAGAKPFEFLSRPEDREAIEKATGFKYAGPIGGKGGLIARQSGGELVYDLTFEKLVEEFWSDNVGEAAALLGW